MLEASDLEQDGTTNLSTVSFSTLAAQSKTTTLSNVVKLADATELKDPEAPLNNVAKRANTADFEEPEMLQDLQDASDVESRDDDADEDEPSNGDADPEEESESSGDEVKGTENMVDADLIQIEDATLHNLYTRRLAP